MYSIYSIVSCSARLLLQQNVVAFIASVTVAVLVVRFTLARVVSCCIPCSLSVVLLPPLVADGCLSFVFMATVTHCTPQHTLTHTDTRTPVAC